MPLPKPKPSGETNAQWMARCMGDPTVKDEMKHDQAVAFCLNSWRQHHGPAATGPAPKRSVKAPAPTPNENHVEYMSRCMGDATMSQHDAGVRAAACSMAWMDAQDQAEGSGMGGGMMMDCAADLVQRDMQMKWMPTLLEVKGINDGARTLSGLATTPNIDLVGDSVVSMGAKYKQPPNIPLLLFHDHRLPVGSVTHVDKREDGIRFQARIAKIDTPGALRDRCEEAFQLVREGLIKGVSIGFTPIPGKSEYIKGGSGGIKFLEWHWHELSLVVVPANQDATVAVVRSLDEQARNAVQEPASAPAPVQKLVKPAPAPPKVIVEQNGVLRWINDPSNARQWREVLDGPRKRHLGSEALARHAAAHIRLRQPKGEITKEQIQFEIWELSRYW